MHTMLQNIITVFRTHFRKKTKQSDVGEHVRRDWFAVLLTTTVLFIVFLVTGSVRFHEVTEHRTAQTQPTFTIPLDETEIRAVLQILQQRSPTQLAHLPGPEAQQHTATTTPVNMEASTTPSIPQDALPIPAI